MARRTKSSAAAADAHAPPTQTHSNEAVPIERSAAFAEPAAFVEAEPVWAAAPIVGAFDPLIDASTDREPAPEFEAEPVSGPAHGIDEFEPSIDVEPVAISEAQPALQAAPSLDDSVPFVEPSAYFEASPAEAEPVLEAYPSVEHFVPLVDAPASSADEPAQEFESAFPSVAPVVEDIHVMEETPILEAASELEAAATPQVEAVATAPTPTAETLLEAPMASIAEAQGKVRTMVETGLKETHAKYSQMKIAADEAAHAIENAYASVKHGAVQFNVRALEALSATATANFDFVKSVFAVKSPSDYVILHSEFARKQIEMMTAQSKAFGELAQKVAADSVEPIKVQVAKSFNMH